MRLFTAQHDHHRLSRRRPFAQFEQAAVEDTVDRCARRVSIEVDLYAIASCGCLHHGLFGLCQFFDGRSRKPLLQLCARKLEVRLRGVECGAGAIEQLGRREAAIMYFLERARVRFAETRVPAWRLRHWPGPPQSVRYAVRARARRAVPVFAKARLRPRPGVPWRAGAVLPHKHLAGVDGCSLGDGDFDDGFTEFGASSMRSDASSPTTR